MRGIQPLLPPPAGPMARNSHILRPEPNTNASGSNFRSGETGDIPCNDRDHDHDTPNEPSSITNVTSRQNGEQQQTNVSSPTRTPTSFPFPFSVSRESMTSASTNGSNESPSLSRAGLLQPKSYASSTLSSGQHFNTLNHYSGSHIPHSQDDIRDSTMQLSNMILSPPTSGSSNSEGDEFIFPGGLPQAHDDGHPAMTGVGMSLPASVRSSVYSTADLSASTVTDASTSTVTSHNTDTTAANDTQSRGLSAAASSRGPPPPPPSGLSILLARHDDSPPSGMSTAMPTPTTEHPHPQPPSGLPPHVHAEGFNFRTGAGGSPSRATVFDGLLSPSPPAEEVADGNGGNGEMDPLLPATLPIFTSYTNPNPSNPSKPYAPPQNPQKLHAKPFLTKVSRQVRKAKKSITSVTTEDVKEKGKEFAKTSITSIPAVILGTLLNILDGVSYGMIIFPAAGVFADLGGMGVSMFFVSAVIAQLVYTFGGSGFAGANGSMMIEVVPFFHIIATTIAYEIGEDKPEEIIATTLVAFALSSVLTGLAFFLLGALRLGALIGFFPRHILVGCIGGVGAFLIETGLTVSVRMSDDDFEYNFATLKFFFEPDHLILWAPALLLAVLLRLITHKFHHQLIFPLYFIVIPMIFYIVVAAAQLDLGMLTQKGWLFDMGDSADESWYEFYHYYDFGKVRFGPLWATLPTQFALLFFNILHPPLNVPALAVSLNEDVDTNKELVAHGYSNLLSGIFGTVPNYLVYVNTLLFYRVGGGHRIAGFLLAVATAILLFIGTGPIAYIPVMVVGALIFVLGIDLVKEALWDTRHRVSRSEYLTIASIVIVMTAWDFVVGVLFGIVVSCFFFVVQNSQRRSIRTLHTGETAISTVRRPSAHRAYIREVSRQTMILRLQGFLFFGTITHVEETIRGIVEDPSWKHTPVRFLVVDLTLVAGVDMSSAEAFVRVQRLLAAKHVVLVFCGFIAESAIGKALQSVGVLGEDFVELFGTFNDAMEWTENAYLRAWFRSQKSETIAVALPGRQDTDIGFHHSLASSPRRSQLQDVGYRTIGNDASSYLAFGEATEPYNTLVKAFSSYGDVDRERLRPLGPYLERCAVPEGLVLWRQDQNPDGLYLIESGVLRASYKFAEHTPAVEESMVPGTLAGELSALAGLPRNATVVVERQAILWKLSVHNMHRLENDDPALATTFLQLVLKAAKIDYDILLSALATRQ